MRSEERAALEAARAEVLEAGATFRAAAVPAVAGALRRRLEAVLEARAEELPPAGAGVRASLDGGLERAVTRGAEEVDRRLSDDGLWLEPLTAPDLRGSARTGPVERWDGFLPEWVITVLRRFAREPDEPALGELDDPGNRIWIAVLSAAKPLDPVLEELGLEPSSTPELGGGHFGLAPRTAAQLDPTGELSRRWKRYRFAFERYRALDPGR